MLSLLSIGILEAPQDHYRPVTGVTGELGAERLIAQQRVWHGKRGICDATLGVEYGTV